MKKLAAIAQHLTILNLFLTGLLAVIGVFVLGPLIDPQVQVLTAVPRKAPPVPAEKPRVLQDYLFISDPSIYVYEAWSRYLLLSVGEEVFLQNTASAEGALAADTQEAFPPMQDYLVIADQNIFHPERKIPALQAEVPRPEFVLYGTLITDAIRLAYLSDRKAVRSTPGRGPRQNSLKLGESLSGYQLREVHHDRIVMARGDDRIEVRVIAPGGKKDRGAGDVMPLSGATDGMTPGAAPQSGQTVGTPAAPASQPAISAPPRTVIRRASPGRQSLAPFMRGPAAQTGKE